MKPSRLALGVVGATLTMGCYTLQPVVGSPPPSGAQVAYDISDVGRVALGGAMGPSIGRIEGRLVRLDSSELLVAVSSVRYLSGSEQAWSGESVRLKPEYISTTYLRRLSKSRTIAASALAIGAAAFIITRSVNGSGTSDVPDRPPRDSIGTTLRGLRP